MPIVSSRTSWLGKTSNTTPEIHKVVMVYKSINGLASDYLRTKFVDRGCISNYSLIKRHLLFLSPALTI